MLQHATSLADQWMQQNLATLWPINPLGEIFGHYDVANFDGSDLYVQTPGGRGKPLIARRDSNFPNLYVVAIGHAPGSAAAA